MYAELADTTVWTALDVADTPGAPCVFCQAPTTWYLMRVAAYGQEPQEHFVQLCWSCRKRIRS